MDCVVVRLLALHAYVLWRESRIEFILFSLVCKSRIQFNPLNAELNPICHLLALLGGPTIVIVSRLRVNTKTWMIYGFFSKLCVCRSVRERKRERERENPGLKIVTDCGNVNLGGIFPFRTLRVSVAFPLVMIINSRIRLVKKIK